MLISRIEIHAYYFSVAVSPTLRPKGSKPCSARLDSQVCFPRAEGRGPSLFAGRLTWVNEPVWQGCTLSLALVHWMTK
jgi:hypothetical protein